MEASTMIMFQPLGPNQAATNGDFAMTADQVNPVAQALRQKGIDLISVHNHLLYEQRRLCYLHYWATGDTLSLARGLRAALDRLR
jgi:hypothetical protein